MLLALVPGCRSDGLWGQPGRLVSDWLRPDEPAEKWFRFYTGPMLPLEDVAVLCHADRSTFVVSIRVHEGGEPQPARHERWHFPLCLEVLPGVYELEVHYLLRETDLSPDGSSTRHAESSQPSRVAWYAEAGGRYVLEAVIGGVAASPTSAPRSRVSRRSSLGTSRFELDEGEWAAQIQRVSAWVGIEPDILEQRDLWERYEKTHGLAGQVSRP